MNARKLNETFNVVKNAAKMDYAITDPDSWGDCMTCTNDALARAYGIDSTGIWAKTWREGINAGPAITRRDRVYIVHDITPEQADVLISTFQAAGYTVSPEVYDPDKCFIIREN